jgi:S-methylmethionine-dependent homocysteine/selenocysteine methylase
MQWLWLDIYGLFLSSLIVAGAEIVLHIYGYLFLSSFIVAGAEIVVTGSYQASIEGFVKHSGVTEEQAYNLIKKSVELAQQAAQEANKITGTI